MKRMKNNSGFTLLEIIIVIIIVGVLASLALPRLFSTIEFSRSTEAFASITTVRSSLERCYLMNDENYLACNTFTSLDIDDPTAAPNAHFTYSIGAAVNAYTITAARKAGKDGGTSVSFIQIKQTSVGVTRAGSGAFLNIKP